MATRAQLLRTGYLMIVLGCLLCAMLPLAAFTPIGLLTAPPGLALITFGALRLDRAHRLGRSLVPPMPPVPPVAS